MISPLVALLAALPVPPAFASPQYAVTFATPPGGFYCPLPETWTGSGHGTVILLARPSACGDGAGFPSSARAFSPGSTPRIEVFYSYWDAEDEPVAPPCRKVGKADLLGSSRPLCRTEQEGLIRISLAAPYLADIPARLELAVVTTPERLDRDIAALRALAASARTCSAQWDNNGKAFTVGRGAPCPANADWF